MSKKISEFTDVSPRQANDEVIVNRAGVTNRMKLDTLNRLNNTTALTTVLQTGGVDSFVYGIDSAPAGFANDWVLKNTVGGNPRMVLKADGKFGWGLGAASPTVDYERSTLVASFTSLDRHTGPVQHTLQSMGSNCTYRMFRANPYNNAQILLGTAGSINWAIGMQFAPFALQNDFTIRRNSLGNPDFVILKSNGYIGIGSVATAPTANLHVRSTSGTTTLLTEGVSGAANIVKSTSSGAANELDRAVTQSSAATYYKRAGVIEWITGVFTNSPAAVEDYTIRRGASFDPAIRVDRTNGFVQIGEVSSSPFASLHVKRASGQCLIYAEALAGQAGLLARSATSNALSLLDRASTSFSSIHELATGGVTKWRIGMDGTLAPLQNALAFKRSLGSQPDMYIDPTTGGIVVGNPTGGAKANGTINAVDLYINDVSVCMPIAAYISLLENGVAEIDLDEWDKYGTTEFIKYDDYGKEVRTEPTHKPAHRFMEKHVDYIMLEDFANFVMDNGHLPMLPKFDSGADISISDKIVRIWEAVDFGAIHNIQLLEKNQKLETKVKDLETRMQAMEAKLINLGV